MPKYKIANAIWSFEFTEDHKKLFKKFETETTEEAIHSIEFYQVEEFLDDPNLEEIKDSFGKTIIKIKKIFFIKSPLLFFTFPFLNIQKKTYFYV